MTTTLDDAKPVARKAHRCDDCGRQIDPGESYRRWKGVGDYGIEVWKSCAHCDALTKLIVEVDHYAYDADYGLVVSEWLRENAAICGLYAESNQFDRRWRDASGALLPLPVGAVREHPEGAQQ